MTGCRFTCRPRITGTSNLVIVVEACTNLANPAWFPLRTNTLTGGSSLMAIERVEAFGLKVVQVLAIIDRMEGGAAAFAGRGYRFSSLLTISDFGLQPPQP